MKYLLHTCITAALLATGSVALAQDAAGEAPVQLYSAKELLLRYPSNSIKSNEVAERAVAEVTKARADIEERFAADQRECYKKFFTTSCIDKIKEQRRIDLASIKPIEIEGNSYIRHAKVDERDRRLAEKNAQNAEKAAANADKPVDERTPKEGPGATEEAQRKARADAYAKRNAEFAEKQRLLKENEAADAQKRAENVQRYEEKVRAAEEKQKEIARKKAEKANVPPAKP
jgi:colicin import membrane protein